MPSVKGNRVSEAAEMTLFKHIVKEISGPLTDFLKCQASISKQIQNSVIRWEVKD